MKTRSFLISVLSLLLVSCGEGEKLTSSIFSIDFGSVTQADISDGTFSASEPINETSFKAAVDNATDDFGEVPSGVRVKAAAIRLNASSSSISGYEQVFSEPMILFVTPEGGTAIDVGELENPEGQASEDFDINANRDAFEPALTTYLNGEFEVGFRGVAGGANAGDFNASFSVQVQFEFFK